MSLSAKLRRAPLRIVTGAFILNSGIGKLSADENTAKMLHGMATGTYPFLGKVQPKLFAKGLAGGEVALGGLLLAPVVSPVIAGGALAGFSGALLNMYWNTEGMHEPGDPRPTQNGLPIAKDVWMFGIGVGLVADGLLEPAHDKKMEIGAAASARGRSAKRSAKKLKKRNKSASKQAKAIAKQTRAELSKRGQKAATKAQKRAAEVQAKAAKKTKGKSGGSANESTALAAAGAGAALAVRAQQARDAAKNYVDEYGPVAVDKARQAADTAKSYVDEYGPVAVDKAKQAADAAKSYVDEYGPVAVDKAKVAAASAQEAAAKAKAAAGR